MPTSFETGLQYLTSVGAAQSSAPAPTPLVSIAGTERSHEENQERAYIAASRRADRSLEARVQSAKMASEIHRRRTGRGLKVSEEIVLKEEMYEEEEDDMPRSYKYLTAHLQTNSPELNHRVNAYISTQTAMAAMARYNEVNRLFSESFPRASSYSQQMHNSLYISPLMNHGPCSPPLPGSAPSPTNRNHPTPAQSHFLNSDRISKVSSGHTPTTASVATPPELSSATTTPDVPEPKDTPYQVLHSVFPNPPLDPQLVQQPTSSFTSELPNEIKMMANIDMSDPMAMHFFGEGTSPAFQMLSEHGGDMPSLDQLNQLKTSDLTDHDQFKAVDEYDDQAFFSPLEGPGPIEYSESMPNDDFSRFDTPACGGTGIDGWESFVDFGTEQ
ncbi:hypothetical protein F5Y19DRAFT_473176 [Xylariaceae sp. FL1651]|nr:hypothetical protein F5Y19DRAFT_473176 [Xylariaceae sp. FL1651]